jgi:CheY-like chemotaxis protein
LDRHSELPMRNEPAPRPVLALTADLLFAGQIQGTARAMDVRAVTVRTGEELLRQATALEPRLILLELDARTVSAGALDVVPRLKSNDATRGIPVVALVAHVREDLIAAARTAGVDRVLARSALARELPQLLAGS